MADDTIKHLPTVEGGPYSKLTKRQKLFVDEYLASRTAAAAYVAAGYKGLHPTEAAWSLLKKPSISDAVIERRRQLLDDVGIRQERVVSELAAIGFVDIRKLENEIGDVIPLHQLDAATAAAVRAVEIEDVSIGGRLGKRYKYQFYDKVKALDKLGQWMKLWESAHASINIDNRRVEINSSPDPRSEATLRAVNDLIESVRSLGAGTPVALPHPNGSVLPVAVRDASEGHGASVVVGEDSGDPDET
jgi:phage terminase small subunit